MIHEGGKREGGGGRRVTMDGRTVLYGDYGRGEGKFLSRPPSGRPIVITALSDPRMTGRTLHHVTAARYEQPRFFAGITITFPQSFLQRIKVRKYEYSSFRKQNYILRAK